MFPTVRRWSRGLVTYRMLPSVLMCYLLEPHDKLMRVNIIIYCCSTVEETGQISRDVFGCTRKLNSDQLKQ